MMDYPWLGLPFSMAPNTSAQHFNCEPLSLFHFVCMLHVSASMFYLFCEKKEPSVRDGEWLPTPVSDGLVVVFFWGVWILVALPRPVLRTTLHIFIEIDCVVYLVEI